MPRRVRSGRKKYSENRACTQLKCATKFYFCFTQHTTQNFSSKIPLLLFVMLAIILLCLASTLAHKPHELYTLKYFSIRGAAETTRVLFAIARQDYEDFRYPVNMQTFEKPEFDEAKVISNQYSPNIRLKFPMVGKGRS